MKKVATKTVSEKKPAAKPVKAVTPAKPVKAVAPAKPIKASAPAQTVKAVVSGKSADMKSVYVKALQAAGYAFDERADRLIFSVKDDTYILMIDENAPECFSLVSGFTLEKIKYPIEIFEEMNLTMQTTPYVRVYSESAGKKGEFVVLFEICQLCEKTQVPMLLKAGIETIAKAMEMFGDMN